MKDSFTDLGPLLLRIDRMESDIRTCLYLGKKIEPKIYGMTFGEALEALKKGKHVSMWSPEDIYVYLNEGLGNVQNELRVMTIAGLDAAWIPNHQELLSNNWRIINDEENV